MLINKDFLHKFKVIFWDFDGVIKDSVIVKREAFNKLFLNEGIVLTKKIAQHHINNGGISRYKKIPLYLSWAGEEINENRVNDLANKFSDIVVNDVIKSKWTKGVSSYLKKYFNHQIFIIVTATPDKEIKFILKNLGIFNYFKLIYGSSYEKKNAIDISIKKLGINRNEAILIGDSRSDHESSKVNQISFALKLTNENKSYQEIYNGLKIKDFS